MASWSPQGAPVSRKPHPQPLGEISPTRSGPSWDAGSGLRSPPLPRYNCRPDHKPLGDHVGRRRPRTRVPRRLEPLPGARGRPAGVRDHQLHDRWMAARFGSPDLLGRAAGLGGGPQHSRLGWTSGREGPGRLGQDLPTAAAHPSALSPVRPPLDVNDSYAFATRGTLRVTGVRESRRSACAAPINPAFRSGRHRKDAR